MRLRLRWVLVLLAAGAAWWAWPELAGLWDRAASLAPPAEPPQKGSGWKLAKVPDALVNEVYVLDRDEWLTFDLMPELDSVRLLTSADLPESRRADFGSPIPEVVTWYYAVRYQLLDSAGRVLDERDHHFQTRLNEWIDPKLGVPITPAYYLGEPVLPTDSRLATIPLTGRGGRPARLRIRMLKADDPLTGVTVRVLYPNPTSPHKLGYFWHRMLEGRKQKLARGNVYSHDLLGEEERRNLLVHLWSPVAPRGVPGADFRQRGLYVLNDPDGEPVRDRPPPTGTLAEPGRLAVLPVPEGDGPVRFVFTPMIPGAGAGGRIELRWYGLTLVERETFHVPWSGRETVAERKVTGGTIEVEAPAAMSVRAYRPGSPADPRRPAGTDEFTAFTTYTWTYLLRGDGPVDFDVLHPAGEVTPVRVDVRRYSPDPDLLRTGRPAGPDGPVRLFPAAKVRYQFLDAAGAVVHEGELAADMPPSEYDRLQMLRQEYVVGDPNHWYFAVPPNVARLRFPAADADALVTVYNRPGTLENLTRVPEDYLSFNHDEKEQRSWFALRSPDHDRLEAANRTPVLTPQIRPPQDDPQIAAGKFEWYEFLPEPNWRGRVLLTPRDPRLPFRAESAVSTYLELPTGRETGVKVVTEPGRAEVTPSLVYARDSSEPFALQIWVGGRLLHEAKPAGSLGEVLLPAVAVPRGGGELKLRVVTSAPARVFLNHVDPGKGPALVRLTAARVAPLEFDYEKVDRAKRPLADELLAFKLFRPLGVSDRARLRVRLDRVPPAAVGPFETWTFRSRVFDLRPAGGDPLDVLGAADLKLDQGQSFFFPVGEDLPKGKYRVRVEPLNGFEGYLLFNRSIPGPYDRREFFEEHPGRLVEGGGGREP